MSEKQSKIPVSQSPILRNSSETAVSCAGRAAGHPTKTQLAPSPSRATNNSSAAFPQQSSKTHNQPLAQLTVVPRDRPGSFRRPPHSTLRANPFP